MVQKFWALQQGVTLTFHLVQKIGPVTAEDPFPAANALLPQHGIDVITILRQNTYVGHAASKNKKISSGDLGVLCRSRRPCIIPGNDRFARRLKMLTIKYSRARVSVASWCRIAIVVLAVFSLTASLATRYSSQGSEAQNLATVKSQSQAAHTQRLLGNALQWTAPAASFTLFQPPRSSVFSVSVVVPSTNLISESWLYNRPPPSY